MEQAYFIDIKQAILQELEIAQKSIKIAVAWFTSQDLFEKILEKQSNGIKVELIILDDFINNGPYGLGFQKFIEAEGVLKYSTTENPLHHKFCIIDDYILINGSYNWTYFAENKNLENIIIIKNNIPLVTQYVREFDKLSSSLISVKHTILREENDKEGSNNIIREYLAYDMFFKGKQINKIEFVEIASRLFPSNTTIESEYKAMTSIKIKKNMVTSLGIKANIKGIDDSFSILIAKGQEVPFTKSETYVTAIDNQKTMTIETFKGDHDIIIHNQKLGWFIIADLPLKPARQTSVTVTFSLNDTGILTVEAQSLDTGSSMSASYNVDNLIF